MKERKWTGTSRRRNTKEWEIMVCSYGHVSRYGPLGRRTNSRSLYFFNCAECPFRIAPLSKVGKKMILQMERSADGDITTGKK